MKKVVKASIALFDFMTKYLPFFNNGANTIQKKLDKLVTKAEKIASGKAKKMEALSAAIAIAEDKMFELWEEKDNAEVVLRALRTGQLWQRTAV